MKIEELDNSISEYEKEILNNLSKEYLSQAGMADEDRPFINGVIRKLRPKNILEVGVFIGGGSTIILNAISDIPNSTLTSIDISKTVNNGVEVGKIAKDLYGECEKWDLFTGLDAVEVLEDLDKKFDLLILDTAHSMPGEVLNFIGILPYLTEDAIVILHDISLHLFEDCVFQNACHKLFSTIVADRVLPFFGNESNLKSMRNIGIFQINNDTKKYIDNLFYMLLEKWNYSLNRRTEDAYIKIVEKYYTKEQLNLLKIALEINYNRKFCTERISLEEYNNYLEKNKVIFYGAPNILEKTIIKLDKLGLKRPNFIWNQNAKNIGNILGNEVTEPNFDLLNQDNDYYVVLFLNNSLLEVSEKISKLNVKNIIHYDEFDSELSKI